MYKNYKVLRTFKGFSKDEIVKLKKCNCIQCYRNNLNLYIKNDNDFNSIDGRYLELIKPKKCNKPEWF